MDGRHHDRAFAEAGSNPLYKAGPDITNCVSMGAGVRLLFPLGD